MLKSVLADMVEVKPSTGFYIDNKPQVYCPGWVDKMTDEQFDICK